MWEHCAACNGGDTSWASLLHWLVVQCSVQCGVQAPVVRYSNVCYWTMYRTYTEPTRHQTAKAATDASAASATGAYNTS